MEVQFLYKGLHELLVALYLGARSASLLTANTLFMYDLLMNRDYLEFDDGRFIFASHLRKGLQVRPQRLQSFLGGIKDL
jgi:hypothetical protein